MLMKGQLLVKCYYLVQDQEISSRVLEELPLFSVYSWRVALQHSEDELPSILVCTTVGSWCVYQRRDKRGEIENT